MSAQSLLTEQQVLSLLNEARDLRDALADKLLRGPAAPVLRLVAAPHKEKL